MQTKIRLLGSIIREDNGFRVALEVNNKGAKAYLLYRNAVIGGQRVYQTAEFPEPYPMLDTFLHRPAEIIWRQSNTRDKYGFVEDDLNMVQ